MFVENAINFRDFFREHFFRVDRKYVDISMPKNMFFEMAVPQDIAKHPIKPDADDIEFVNQFDSEYQAQALHQRYYHDLKEALKERNQRRSPAEKNMYEIIKKAIFNGEYHGLKNVVSDELFYRLQNQEYAHVKGEEQLAEKAAKYLAELETEKQVPHTAYPPAEEGLPPGYKKYTFKAARRGNKTKTFIAKPFMNRLIHKLERTKGHEHHPDSGLHELGTTHGQYGYDLYGLKEGDDVHPHSTRGMQLPKQDEIALRYSDFLQHNAHGMYGALSEEPDIVWKPVGAGRQIYHDNWTWKKVYNKLFPQWVSKVQTAEPGSFTLPDGTKIPPEKGFRLANQIRAAAHKLAMEDVFKMAESGELKGPPIPGIAPEGLPVKVKVGAGGKKTIDAPILYLPHKKMPVRSVGEDGQIKKDMQLMPIVNPAQYLRELGSEEGDEAIEADQLRGHKKDYVHVPHNEYKHAKGYVAGGAFHVAQNSAGREHLDQSDPEYQERKEEVEREMGLTSLDQYNKPTNNGEGQYFYDIIKGIWNCISSACGGMTANEVEIMRQDVPDLHQMIYQKMMMSLRKNSLDTPTGRRSFSSSIASSWAQQDLGKGGGTRRLRRLNQDARDESLDAETQGKGGEALSLRDSIMMRMKTKESGDASKLKQGEKLLPTGKHQFSYNIDNLREIISTLEGEAKKVDSDRDEAIKLSRADISDQIADLIGDALTDKAAVIFQLQYHLKNLFITAGAPANEADFKATQKIQEYGSQSANTVQIIAAFKADNMVQQLLNTPESSAPGEEKQLSMAEQDAVEALKEILAKIPPARLKDPATQQMIYNYIADRSPDVQNVLKVEADKIFGKITTQSVPQQTPEVKIGWKQHRDEVNNLMAQKKWLKVAEHPYFLHQGDAQRLNAVMAKLQFEMQNLPSGADIEDYQFAISHIQGVLNKHHQGGISEIT